MDIWSMLNVSQTLHFLIFPFFGAFMLKAVGFRKKGQIHLEILILISFLKCRAESNILWFLGPYEMYYVLELRVKKRMSHFLNNTSWLIFRRRSHIPTLSVHKHSQHRNVVGSMYCLLYWKQEDEKQRRLELLLLPTHWWTVLLLEVGKELRW